VIVLTHSYVITRTGNAYNTMRRFHLSINNNLSEALNNVGKYARYYSMISAPVYNPAKYPDFYNFKNHYTPPGKLKSSIRKFKTKRAFGFGRGNKGLGVDYFSVRIGSRVKYASYMERGFRHHLSGKIVRGRRFLRGGARLAVSRHHKMEIEKAVRKSFGRVY